MANREEERAQRIEDLVHRVERIPDRESRETAQSLMEAILEFHGSGMERMMDIVYESGSSGQSTIRHLAGDPLVSSLLLLHNLHPDDLETRVQHALGKLHGSAELRGVFEGVVRMRLTGSGCGLKESVKAAIQEAAPDAVEIVVEEQRSAANGFVPLDSLLDGFPGSV